MGIYTQDDSGQIILTPPELDEFEHFRDNVLVRKFREFLENGFYEYVASAAIWVDYTDQSI